MLQNSGQLTVFRLGAPAAPGLHLQWEENQKVNYPSHFLDVSVCCDLDPGVRSPQAGAGNHIGPCNVRRQ